MRPPFPYFGGKQRLAEIIAALLPEHEHYVEPFAGSLAVLLAKRPSKMETVNDLDGDLVTFWRVLRDREADLVRVAAATPHARAEAAACRDLDVDDELERARRVWVLLSQGRSGTLLRTGWRNYEARGGSSMGMPAYLTSYVDRMPPAARRLRDVSLECRPALDVISAYGAHPTNCIYADPPYLGTTRAPGNRYQHELRTEDEHRDLADALAGCRASVVLSGYHSPLYDELYAGWDRVEMASGTSQAGGDYATRTEVLWSNRPLRAADLLDQLAATS